jgi:pterin-4a-carbinolamine dehydratase
MRGKNLLREYVTTMNNRPSFLEDVPLKAQEAPAPIIPQEKWLTTAGALTKKFNFRTIEQRNYFLTELLCYEQDNEHYASYIVRENSVVVSVITKNINTATNRDQEFAQMCNQLYKCAALITSK